MKYSEGKVGRVFVVRLEDKDKLPEVLEKFSRGNNLLRGMCIFVGGIGDGKIVVGPESSTSTPIIPLIHSLQGVHEICAVGTIFPDEQGEPRLHMHAALGRAGKTRTGCIRPGIKVSNLGEVIVFEIVNNNAQREEDKEAGFLVLKP